MYGFEKCHCIDCRIPLPFEENEWIDLGHGIEYQETTTDYSGIERVTGILLTHNCSIVDHCLLDIPFDITKNKDMPEPKWRLNSLVSLDISPSVVVKECGLHGFIKNGKWESTISKVPTTVPQDYRKTPWDMWDYWMNGWD